MGGVGYGCKHCLWALLRPICYGWPPTPIMRHGNAQWPAANNYPHVTHIQAEKNGFLEIRIRISITIGLINMTMDNYHFHTHYIAVKHFGFEQLIQDMNSQICGMSMNVQKKGLCAESACLYMWCAWICISPNRSCQFWTESWGSDPSLKLSHERKSTACRHSSPHYLVWAVHGQMWDLRDMDMEEKIIRKKWGKYFDKFTCSNTTVLYIK